MRKLILFDLISANGFFERGPWELDWHHTDDEFGRFAIQQLDDLGTIVFGRATYEGMAAYWGSKEGSESEPETARRMNAIDKVVFSKTLTSALWQNTRIAGGDLADEVARLKAAPGKAVAVFGSSDLAAALADRGLIDEYRILVNPIAFGRGKPLLAGLERDLLLELRDVRRFGNGNVLLTYAPRQRS